MILASVVLDRSRLTEGEQHFLEDSMALDAVIKVTGTDATHIILTVLSKKEVID